ncbi:hypothetical protein D9M72_496250 [compost metagenome]
MVAPADKAERVGRHRLHRQPFAHQRIDQHAEIDGAGADLLQAVGLHVVAHGQPDIGVLRGAGGDIHRHQPRGNGRSTSYHDATAIAFAQLTRFFEGVVELAQQPLQRRHQRVASIGQHHFTRGAVKQLDTKCLFKLCDAPADRRLGQSHHLRGAAETAAAGHRQEDAQLAQCVIHATTG